MTQQQFPIPDKDQVIDWINNCTARGVYYYDDYDNCDYEKIISELAAAWAADVQLEAVKEYLCRYFQWADEDLEELHNAIRKTPSLKDQVMDIVERARHGHALSSKDWDEIDAFIRQSHT